MNQNTKQLILFPILLENVLETCVIVLMKLISADTLYEIGEQSAEEVADRVPKSLPAACFLKTLRVILFFLSLFNTDYSVF